MTAAGNQAARRPAGRRVSYDPDDTDNPNIIVAVIRPLDPNAPPVKRPPSSRTIVRLREKAEAAAKAAAAARALSASVQRGLRPPPGRMFGVDAGALVLLGPGGGIGTTIRTIETLKVLAQGGRHPAAALAAAGGWADEGGLREALDAIAPKLAAIGLRLCRRKAGLRMAKQR